MKCCICGKEIEGYGNNPWPATQEEDARCCDDCNWSVVIPARIESLIAYEEKMEMSMDDEADFGETDGAECSVCSVCGYTTISEYWAKTYYHYCPNCGTDMRGGVNGTFKKIGGWLCNSRNVDRRFM